MPDGPSHIGRRLRDERRRRGISLTELADRSGMSKGFLSQVERDLAVPSVATLLRVCEVVGMPVRELFSAHRGPLVRAAERAPIEFGGERVEEFQLTPAGESRLLVVQSEIGPGGGSGDERYTLQTDAEFVHVLSGALHLEVGDAAYRLSAGDSLTFDACSEHRWRNPSAVWPTRVLWVMAPALP